MLDKILQLDHQLFYAINTGLSNVFFDMLMPILRNKLTWIPLYIAIVILLIKTYKSKGFVLIFTLIVCVGFADYSSASLIKKAVKRPRPCNESSFKAQVNMLVSCGTGYSLPSTHATDHFAIAVFLIILFRKKIKYLSVIFLSWAFLISFAQVYVGVHFPIDVISGALYGTLIGWCFASFFNYKFPKLISL